jgi:MFS family permease
MGGQRRLFYGWVVVATAAIGLLFGAFPIAVSCFGIFFHSFIQQFHANRAAVSLAFTINNLVTAMLAVFVGRLSDRVGARKVILPGLAIFGLVLLSAEMIGSKLWHLYLFYALLGTVANATNSVPYGLVVSRWFNRRRGVALGLMMAGLGTGAILMPPLAQHLISTFGWRGAFAIIGCAILAIPIPLVGALLKERPEQMGMTPDGESQPSGLISDGQQEGATWNEVWRSEIFWLMILAFVLIGASVHACIIHIPELFADRGASTQSATLASSVAGFALLAGRVGSGYFLDRYFGGHVARVIFATTGFGITLLWTGSIGLPALLAVFLVGLGFGAEVDIMAYLISRYFGLRALGTAFGFAFGAFVLAGGLGPLMMGAAFDHTKSYRIPLAGFFVATVVAAVLVGRLGPYRYNVKRAPGIVTRSRAGVGAKA